MLLIVKLNRVFYVKSTFFELLGRLLEKLIKQKHFSVVMSQPTNNPISQCWKAPKKSTNLSKEFEEIICFTIVHDFV